MGIENNRKLIVNCLPLMPSEQAQFMRAAKGVPQEKRRPLTWRVIDIAVGASAAEAVSHCSVIVVGHSASPFWQP